MAYAWEEGTLQELEGEDWGEPTYDSYVVTTCHRMRRKRICDLTVEELRLAIGQQMGLKFLLPIAIRKLNDDPFVSGDFYPGDLLRNVARAPFEAWAESPELTALLAELKAIIALFFQNAEKMDDAWKKTCLPDIRDACEPYLRMAN
jgi:hypothetical protein